MGLPARRLTVGNRLTLGWGKLRRAWLITFEPEKVRRKLARRVGGCDRSGACCKLGYACPAYDDSNGRPRCTVYADRPAMCMIFPIDEQDLKERDLIEPGTACGHQFTDDPALQRKVVFPWEALGRRRPNLLRSFCKIFLAGLRKEIHGPPPPGEGRLLEARCCRRKSSGPNPQSKVLTRT